MTLDIRSLLEPLVDVLEEWAARTDTRIDDAGVQLLRRVLANDVLLNWLVGLLITGRTPESRDDVPLLVDTALIEVGCTNEEFNSFTASVLPTVGAICETQIAA